MYVPVLRARRHELLAVRRDAAALALSGNVLPVFEAVNANHAALHRCLAEAMAQNLAVGVVLNPRVNPRTTIRVWSDPTLRQLILQSPLIVPTIFLDTKTPTQRLAALLTQFPQRPILVMHADTFIASSSVLGALKQHSPGVRHLMPEPNSGRCPRPALSLADRVTLRDGFQSAASNAAYPGESFFCAAPRSLVAAPSAGIGDFCTVGKRFREGGSTPNKEVVCRGEHATLDCALARQWVLAS